MDLLAIDRDQGRCTVRVPRALDVGSVVIAKPATPRERAHHDHHHGYGHQHGDNRPSQVQLGQVKRELARRFAGLRHLAGFPALRDIAFGNALTCGISAFAFSGALEHALPAFQPALGGLAGNGGASGVLRLLGIGLGDGPLHLLRLIGSGFLGLCDREALQTALQRGAFAFRRGGLLGRRSGFPGGRGRRGVPVTARLHRGDVQRLARLRRLAGSAFRHGRPRRLRDRRPGRLQGGLRGRRPRRGPDRLRSGRPCRPRGGLPR